MTYLQLSWDDRVEDFEGPIGATVILRTRKSRRLPTWRVGASADPKLQSSLV
jgi:hypothetical protein